MNISWQAFASQLTRILLLALVLFGDCISAAVYLLASHDYCDYYYNFAVITGHHELSHILSDYSSSLSSNYQWLLAGREPGIPIYCTPLKGERFEAGATMSGH